MAERKRGFRAVLGSGNGFVGDADFCEQKRGKAVFSLVLRRKRAGRFFFGAGLRPMIVQPEAAAGERAHKSDLAGLREDQVKPGLVVALPFVDVGKHLRLRPRQEVEELDDEGLAGVRRAPDDVDAVREQQFGCRDLGARHGQPTNDEARDTHRHHPWSEVPPVVPNASVQSPIWARTKFLNCVLPSDLNWSATQSALSFSFWE